MEARGKPAAVALALFCAATAQAVSVATHESAAIFTRAPFVNDSTNAGWCNFTKGSGAVIGG
ncbi:hypothetical protein GX586_11925, partial [bacterium]|nr:hypothetical protein [bacterium]